MEHSFESIEKSLNTAFEKGLISEDLLEKALEELDLIKGSSDPTHGGKLKPKYIINKQGKKQLVYVLPEEVTSEHQSFKQGDKFKTKNGEEHDFVKDKGHDNKGGHLVTLKDKTGRIHDKYIHNLESVEGDKPKIDVFDLIENFKQGKESNHYMAGGCYEFAEALGSLLEDKGLKPTYHSFGSNNEPDVHVAIELNGKFYDASGEYKSLDDLQDNADIYTDTDCEWSKIKKEELPGYGKRDAEIKIIKKDFDAK